MRTRGREFEERTVIVDDREDWRQVLLILQRQWQMTFSVMVVYKRIQLYNEREATKANEVSNIVSVSRLTE